VCKFPFSHASAIAKGVEMKTIIIIAVVILAILLLSAGLAIINAGEGQRWVDD